MLKTKVILSRVNNLSDARYASGMGVDYIGFSINPENTNYVTVEQAKMISDWISGVSIIGEIGDSMSSDMEAYAIDFVQTSNFSLIDELEEPILSIELNMSNFSDIDQALQKFANKVSFSIIKVLSNQLSILLPQLRGLCKKFPVFIATEFDDQKLTLVLDKIKPMGIVLYGSNEIKPGLSSYDGIANILEQLEVE